MARRHYYCHSWQHYPYGIIPYGKPVLCDTAENAVNVFRNKFVDLVGRKPSANQVKKFLGEKTVTVSTKLDGKKCFLHYDFSMTVD